MQFSVSVGTLYFPLLSGYKPENRQFGYNQTETDARL